MEAIAALTEAIKLKPDYAIAYNGRGYAHHLAHDYKNAIADYDQAIRLNSSYLNAIKNRANARRSLGDTAGANADRAKADSLEGK